MFDISNKRVDALLAPRNVVIVGASDRKGSWGWRSWRNLRAHGYPNPIFPLNPNRDEVWGTACYRNFNDMPETPDHLAIYVPAELVPDAILSGASAGARTATIFSTGFGEGESEAGASLKFQLEDAISSSGIAVSGPNCVGNFNTASKLVTLVEDRQHDMTGGSIAIVGQSGGALMFLKRALEERRLAVSCLVTSGNEIGLNSADYVAYLADRPDIRTIILYLENIRDPARFAAATELAAERGKTVIAYKIGRSDAGRAAALAHTGALAGRIDAFDAAYTPRGLIRVESLDEAVEVAELSTRLPGLRGNRIGGVTTSGAFRGLLLDNADRCGVVFPALQEKTMDELSSLLGATSYVSNPVDGGYSIVSNPDNLLECVNILAADKNLDMILVQGAAPASSGNARAERYIDLCAEYSAGEDAKPLAMISFGSYGLTDHSEERRRQAPKVAFLQEISKGMMSIGRLARVHQARDARLRAVLGRQGDAAVARNTAWLEELATSETVRALSETESKALLGEFGIGCPAETVVGTQADAIKAARAIGYPVVLKLVSSEVIHKSDVGGVFLNLRTDAEVVQAYDKIQAVASKLRLKSAAVLVATFVQGGVECALGIHHDPEAGHIVMLAYGGTLLEIVKDAQFRATPVSEEIARQMIDGLRSKPLLQGYRGARPVDVDGLVRAVVQLSRVAEELGDYIESIDVNPLLVTVDGCVALDASVILKSAR